jgi:hypothetical protein
VKIHGLAHLSHHLDHVQAVWKHLPPSLKGELRTGRTRSDRGWPAEDLVLVAGYDDVEAAPSHRLIYIEHGAGQSYGGDRRSAGHRSYSGSTHPERVVGYISPRVDVAESWGRPAFAAGSPICDPYPLEVHNERPLAAITFHWPARLCPEAGTALPYYADRLAEIVMALIRQGFEVVGHHHPRERRLNLMWPKIGVRIASADEIRQRANLLIADNTSMLYEMCYLGRYVISLNSPEYRRDVNHGLRFWDAVPGLEIDTADQLIDTLYDVNFADPKYPMMTTDAKAAYDKILNDGRDGKRASTWVTSLAATL